MLIEFHPTGKQLMLEAVHRTAILQDELDMRWLAASPEDCGGDPELSHNIRSQLERGYSGALMEMEDVFLRGYATRLHKRNPCIAVMAPLRRGEIKGALEGLRELVDMKRSEAREAQNPVNQPLLNALHSVKPKQPKFHGKCPTCGRFVKAPVGAQ
jgi:hypothetical protein